MSALRLAIQGAAGRMGRRLIALASAEPQMQVVAALESAKHPDLGSDAGLLAGIHALGVPVAATLSAEQSVDCVIDFSVPEAVEGVVALCRTRRLPLGGAARRGSAARRFWPSVHRSPTRPPD